MTSGGIQFEDRENLPEKPPFLIAFNHFGWVEGIVPHILLPAKNWPYVITKIENMNGLLGKILQSLGFIGVRRGEADIHAIRRALDLLGSGQIIATALNITIRLSNYHHRSKH